MYNLYNLKANLSQQTSNESVDNLLILFKKFLVAEKISSGSIRSYLSDVRHFLGWLVLFLQANHILKEAEMNLLPYVNPKVLESYKNYLTGNNVPLKTANRRFSALRKFGDFCLSQNWLSLNTFDTLRTISQEVPFPEEKWHLGEFRVGLWKNNASKSTIKNYLNDVKQFIGWAERKNNLKF